MTDTCGFDVSSLLDVIPQLTKVRGSAISTQWLSQHLSTPPIDVDEMTLERNARCFILALLGSFIFSNKKGLHVHLCFLPLLRDLT